MIKNDPIRVEILLSTYNGEKYIDQQLKSIINQTYKNWIISIRDDGSIDSTIDIILKYIECYPKKITLLNDSKGNLGPSKSFESLIYSSKEKYLLFCDQDDEWIPDKIKLSVAKMLLVESKHNNTPILIFTDLIVVDEKMNILNTSFWKSQKLDPEIAKNYIKLAALNVITGCTIILNSETKKYILPFPDNYSLHDYWIGLNISYYGIIDYITTPTVLYRQHGNNAVGAHKINFLYFYKKVKKAYTITNYFIETFSKAGFKINFVQFLYFKLYFSIKRTFHL